MRTDGKASRYAVGLYRVSTAEQGNSGLGLEAQQASVRTFATAQGWTMIAEFSDIASGKDDRRPGFQAALTRCRQLGAILVAARLDRITRRAHTLSQLLEHGYSIRVADMPGADDLMMRIYAAMAQKERELISERTKAALTAARARGKALGGDRGYRPSSGPDARAAARVRREGAERSAHRLVLELEAVRAEGNAIPCSHRAGDDAAGRSDPQWRERLDAYDGLARTCADRMENHKGTLPQWPASIEAVIVPRVHDIGGFEVRRALPASELCDLTRGRWRCPIYAVRTAAGSDQGP
jgi:DNA invertase Pin-like site-specific DNA recombinase